MQTGAGRIASAGSARSSTVESGTRWGLSGVLGGYPGSRDARPVRTPAKYSLEALEQSVVLRFDRTLLESLVAEHPCWRELLGRGAEVELVRKLDADLRARTQTA